MSDSSAYASSSGSKVYLDRAYALQSPSEARTLYDEWAENYDRDLSGLDYVFHRHAARKIIESLLDVERAGNDDHDEGEAQRGKRVVRALDAGCGTGLVGVALDEDLKGIGSSGKHIQFEITGVDISTGMLEVARKTGLYEKLDEVDLTKPLEYPSDGYDIVVCVGTLTRGHVGPGVLSEFVRVLKKGGFIVATVLDEIWVGKGFEKEVQKLAGKEEGSEKLVVVVSNEEVGVVKTSEEGGRLLVLRKV